MKKITIGKQEYELMQNPFDINDERFVVFKQHLLQVFENLNKPLFAETYSKCISNFNAGQHADTVIELTNFKKAIELKELNYDAYSICFALICLEKGEDQKDCSTSHQIDKLERMRKDGLNRGFVEETVENFMKASPKTFGVYLAMLEMMKPQLQGEFLKGSPD